MNILITKNLKRMAKKYPITAKLILENDTENIRCNRCGNVVLKETFVKGYPYQCMNCDENMYGIETYIGSMHSINEITKLFGQTRDLLMLDKNSDKITEKEKAAKLLLGKRVILGYELEDGELKCKNGKTISQFLVRPISEASFTEIWEHGRKYCSKFTIYLKYDDLLVERRPDMLNYDVKDDCMYGNTDVVAGGKEYNEEFKKFIKADEKYYNDYMRTNKKMMYRRIKWALDHFSSARHLEDGKINILFEE